MEKTGVVIGASRDAIHTLQKAKVLGVRIVALDGNQQAEGFKYADESRVVDISDMEKTYEEVVKLAPDFIVPVPIGRYLLTTGYVNEKCGLKGIQYNETNYSTDKYLFHEKLQEQNLRKVKLYLVNKDVSLESLKISYPAILKPRYGSGSRDVFYIENDMELRNAYAKIVRQEEDFVLEQAVQGIEYGVDGAVIGGELKLTLLRKKMNTPLPVRQAIASFAVMDTAENQQLLSLVKQHLQKVVKLMGYNDCLINADIIVEGANIFTIEISPRPSGHNLHNLFTPLATGVDMAEEYIKFLLNEECNFVPDNVRCLQIRFFDFEDVILKRIPDKEELERSGKCKLLKWICNMKTGDYLDKVVNGHSIMGRGLFIVEGMDEQDLICQSEWILSQFEFEEKKNGICKK